MSEARACFSEALRIAPCSPHACHAWGLLEMRGGNPARAREIFATARQDHPGVCPTPQIFTAAAELEAGLGNFDASRALFEEGCARLRKKKDVVDVLMHWARMEEGPLGSANPPRQDSTATALLRRAISLNAGSAVRPRVALAQMMSRLNDVAEARRLFVEAERHAFPRPIARARGARPSQATTRAGPASTPGPYRESTPGPYREQRYTCELYNAWAIMETREGNSLCGN